MAAYTPVTPGDFRPLAATLGLELAGELTAVAEGVENTTYFFRAIRNGGAGGYVLTLVETADAQQIDFAARLATHLHQCRLPVPAPLAAGSGERIHRLAGKPALVFDRIAGRHPDPVENEHCAAIGDFLARAHLAAADWPATLDNRRGLGWMMAAAEGVEKLLGAGDRALLAGQLSRYRQLLAERPALPRGAIHGDLFHDNSLFADGRLAAVIDFYNASSDWLLLDVAVAVNDWCRGEAGAIAADRFAALVGAYRQVRPFSAAEIHHWPEVLAIAATRFWLSRLLAAGGHGGHKDPGEYRAKLLDLRQGAPALPGALLS
ncbi:MAG: homoserine kinase [Porticoccaceae bacterium]|jgi:homoserine kinase type II